MIISINRPISDPGICGTGGTNFDSEKTSLFLFFFTLEIKLGISTLRGENTFSRLQFMGNFSFFPFFFLSATRPGKYCKTYCSFCANNLL